jgi:beta-lactamase class A
MKKFLIVSFIASLFFNIYLFSQRPKASKPTGVIIEEYPFLARRIFLENANDVIINFVPLRQKLREYVAQQDERIGVYFEYLPTGVGIGVNDREEFFRASLVKVPAVMSAYKLIEEGLLSESEPLVLKEHHLDSAYGTLWMRGAGTTLTVGEAIRLTIVESDNTAYEVLNEKVNEILQAEVGEEKNIADVYDYLDIPHDEEGLTQEITPRNYSSILRSLFFSAYLDYEDSNDLLRLMSESVFEEGIALPLLGKAEVAHKFGVHNVEPERLKVHSDCGIVYLPKRPYLICVMISSGDAATAQYMQDISQIVFDYISSVNAGGENE